MPDFLPEGNEAKPTDDERRSWLKIASLTSGIYGSGQNTPEPSDDVRILAHKTTKSLYAHAS
jgi:hypothetical protein